MNCVADQGGPEQFRHRRTSVDGGPGVPGNLATIKACNAT